MRRSKSKVRGIVGTLLILVIILMSIGGIVYLTRNDGVLNGMYVLYNGEKIASDTSGLMFHPFEKQEFEVCGNWGAGYSAVIEPVSGMDFSFTVYGESYSFASEKLNGFTLSQNGNRFTITPDGALKDMIAAAHHVPSAAVVFPDTMPAGDLFVLTIASAGKEIAISFSVDLVTVKIELNYGSLVF